jgi:hypothetical protein
MRPAAAVHKGQRIARARRDDRRGESIVFQSNILPIRNAYQQHTGSEQP